MSAFSRLSQTATKWIGKPATFALAVSSMIVWAAAGPFYGFSDTWQLVCNTGTTVVTFLVVFLIQATQNRDTAALHAKIDELIRSSSASNRFIGLDSLTDEEIEALRDKCKRAAAQEPARPNKPRPARAKGDLPPWPWGTWPWGL